MRLPAHKIHIQDDQNTAQSILTAHSQAKQLKKPIFIRDNELIGFGLKVLPSSKVKFIVEGFKLPRRTLGAFNHSYRGNIPISISEAREVATVILDDHFKNSMRLKERLSVSPIAATPLERFSTTRRTLQGLLEIYLTLDLKESTRKDYRFIIECYLKDWLHMDVADITRKMVEERFVFIRDVGIKKPSHSQASKVMRVLTTILNYAIGDEMIERNPCDVLKLKRYKRFNVARTNHLTQQEANVVMKSLGSSVQDLTVKMLLCTGCRKSEVQNLKWSNLHHIDGLQYIKIIKTKNGKPHLIPVTNQIQEVINAVNDTNGANGSGEYIFGKKCLRATFDRLSCIIDKPFTAHDLRRTFATVASDIGIDFYIIKRLLNHHASDVTTKHYIQFETKKNILNLMEQLERVVY